MTVAVLDSATQFKLRRLCEDRQRARTDLTWLMHDVLGYKDIEDAVHGPIVDALPKFQGGSDAILSNGTIQYTPLVELWKLEGSRKRLILYPRGHLKTSIITVAGTIQWMLNYPDIRVLITSATADLAQKILNEIKSHFQFNPFVRFLFPEFCPLPKRAADWGNQESFTLPCRKRKQTKEPTCSVSSVGKVIAGNHYEVLVCSDMVDKENVRTPGGVREVIDHFNYMDPLLERSAIAPHHGWITVEGTRYAFADLYGKILKDNALSGEWTIVHGDAEVDPDKKVSLWPSRFPWEELKRMESSMGPYLYSSQMRNRPMADSGGLATEDDITWFNAQTRAQLRNILRLHTTIDVAGMEVDSHGDYTVITTAGFDKDGRCYVIEIKRGHFNPEEVINHIFRVWAVYRPIDIKIEKDAHARVLGHFLRREMGKRQIFPTIVELKRDTRTSKIQRIKGLQPWFAAKIIRFWDGLDCKTDLVREIIEFPSSAHDDILDTIADQMQNRDGGVNYDVIPDAEKETPWGEPLPKNRFIGFDEQTKQQIWLYDQNTKNTNCYHEMTGL